MGQQARVKTTIQRVLFCLTLIPAITQAAVVWTAYNDCLTDQPGYTQDNVTRWTIYNDYTGNYTGPLKNYSSGSTTDMPTVTFSMAGSGILTGSGGGNFNAGTPAYIVFEGILDFSPRVLRYSNTAGWAQEIEFSNLDPALTYTFVGTAIRTENYETRKTLVTISGHDSAINNSSTGAMFVSKTATTTVFRAGNNTISGDVVRWDDIVCGADGKFKIRSEAAVINQAYPLGGFMLQANGSLNQAPAVNAGTDIEITLPVCKATMNATVTDDGLGNPDGYLGYQWSVVSGPGTVTLAPSGTVLNPEARFELDQPGSYVLRLTATDGALSDSDDVCVTVHPPVCPMGDLDGNCLVDIQDLEVLALEWLETGSGLADLTDDGSVDLADYRWLAGTWQENQQKGVLQVTINPEAARNSGARWRVDAGAWRPSGDIAQDLSVGTHTVEFGSIADFDAPANQNVSIVYNQTTQAAGTYTQHVGSLQVDITPTEVVGSARWRRVGQTAWRTSGSGGREDGIPVGVHYIEFNLVSGWLKPPVTEVGVNSNQLTTIDAGYTELGTVSLRINEFMADNTTATGITDNYGDYDDWIEIYNMGDASIDLGGLYIADDSTTHQIPTGYAAQTTVPSQGYMILWADNETNEGPLHLPFKLSAAGDAITLYQADSTTVIDSITFGSQVYNHSYGRFPDGANDCYFFSPPTFNASNSSTGIANRVADTSFSPDRGFYTDPFTVLISSDTPGASIYYTTNCSDPITPDGTPTATAVLYSETTKPQITTTTCLRAAAVKTDYIPTNIDTQTYIFLDDVFQQATDPGSGGQVVPAGYPEIWPAGLNWSYQTETGEKFFIEPVTGDYQVDPEIVNHINPDNRLVAEDMLSVPTICVTMNKDLWFDPVLGIYVNEGLNFRVAESQEYACSFEYIDPARGKAVQQNCAIAMAGGVSGSGTSLDRWKNFKLSMRPRFKQVTDDGVVTGGAGKLSFSVFADSPVNDFDSIVLDAVSNNAWSHIWNQSPRYVLDQCTADLHNAMGGHSPHGAFAHVYINGMYWGMYYIHERPDHSWAAEMFGGDKAEYDCIKHSSSGMVNDGVGGSGATNNYNAMLSTASYAAANPGSLTAWQAVEECVDVDNLITYLLTNWFVGNTDWPGKNWYATHRVGGQWRWHSWDAEHTFENASANRVGNSPSGIHGTLINHPEYKIRLADHIHKHFHNGGVLSYPRSWDYYQARMSEIDQAIRGESARWGDRCYDPSHCYTVPKTRTDWLNTSPQNGGFFPTRTDTVFSQLETAGLYPSVSPPGFSVNGSAMYGGYAAYGDSLTITYPTGSWTIWYTLNGEDPRLPGGTRNPNALQYTGEAISLTHSVHVKARVLYGQWSALSEAVFAVGPVKESLRITELMYHPADPPISDPNCEYIELKNIGSETINLSLVRFTNGVDLELPYLQLAPGAYAVVVKDAVVFGTYYDTTGITVVSLPFVGSLDNGGERIVLTDARGLVIHDFKYDDDWYDITDGDGFSLTIKDPNATDLSLWDQKAGWRPSAAPGGSPGRDDAGIIPPLGSIVINEVLSHSHDVEPDWIELYNTTDQAINLGGWFLSDSNFDDLNRKKYRIAEGISIPAYGYRVFYEDQHFGLTSSDPGRLVPFGLSEGGETAYLFSGDGTSITGYFEEESFGAAESGVAFGRYYKASTDSYNFVAMSINTPEGANAYPKVGPISISEIMYHPPAGGTYDNDEYEYIELRNITPQAVALQEYDDLLDVYVSWKLTDGVDYTFPPGVTIPANGTIVVVKNISAFSDRYPSVPTGKIYGPYSGKLDNGGEKVELSKPGDQEEGVRYYIRMDRVVYSDGSHPVGDDPWPTAADGQGMALTRTDNSLYGNDIANWTAAPATPAQ